MKLPSTARRRKGNRVRQFPSAFEREKSPLFPLATRERHAEVGIHTGLIIPCQFFSCVVQQTVERDLCGRSGNPSDRGKFWQSVHDSVKLGFRSGWHFRAQGGVGNRSKHARSRVRQACHT